MSVDSGYVNELIAEKERLDPSCTHAARLLAQEIDRLQTGTSNQDKLVELHTDRPMNLAVKVHLPVREYPKVNFPGRLIGPKGSVMKQFQDKTGTKLCVFGRGSMTDKAKEEELRQKGGKYSHLNQDLHVQLTSYGHPVECYRRMSIALHELRAYLGPDDPSALTPANGSPYPPAPVRGMMPRGPGPVTPRGPTLGGPRPAPYPAPGADPWASGFHDPAGVVSPTGRPARPGYPGAGPRSAGYDSHAPRQSASTIYGQYGAVVDFDDYQTPPEHNIASTGTLSAAAAMGDWYTDSLPLVAGGGKTLPTFGTPSFRPHPYKNHLLLTPNATRPHHAALY